MRRCWLARTLDLDPCSYRADGRADNMHLGFSKNWLTKAPTGPHMDAESAMDGAIIRDGCRKHHSRLDIGSLSLTRSQLPDSVERWASENGLLWKLDRDYPTWLPHTDSDGRLGDDMDGHRSKYPAQGTGHSPSDEDVERGAS